MSRKPARTTTDRLPSYAEQHGSHKWQTRGGRHPHVAAEMAKRVELYEADVAAGRRIRFLPAEEERA